MLKGSGGREGGTDGDLSKMTHSMSGWMAYWCCPPICGNGQLREPVNTGQIPDKICRRKNNVYHSSLCLYAMPVKPDSISKCLFSLKGSLKESAVSIHSAQFRGQVVLWSTT